MSGKRLLDRGITVASAVAAPVLTLLVDQHVMSIHTSIDLGAVVAALVATYHGGAVAQKRLTSAPAQPVEDLV